MTTIRWVMVIGLTAVVTAAAAGAPRLLRGMESFRVQRVAVLGTRYAPPHEILERSGIGRDASVFDDVERWKSRVTEHPLVEAVEIERQLPGTVVVEVTERVPVALVAGRDGLQPVDADGRVLPIDPAGEVIDLPLLLGASGTGPDGALTDTLTLGIVRLLERISRERPDLAERISEARALASGVRLVLTEPSGAVLALPGEPSAEVIRRIGLVLDDLAARGDDRRLQRLDARFRGQVVVSLASPTNG